MTEAPPTCSESTYDQWFMGDHQGPAPASPPVRRDASEPYYLNGMDSVVTEIARFRETTVLAAMDPDTCITRSDQFGVFLRLADALDEAVGELLAIGWPFEEADGTILWNASESAPRPDAAAQRAEAAALASRLLTGHQETLI